MDPKELRSFKHAARIVERFERAIGSYGVEIKSGSTLEAVCLEIQDFEDKRSRRSPIPSGIDYRLSLSNAMGVLHFAELLVATVDRGRQLHVLTPHMRLLSEPSVLVAQNVRKIGDDSANKLFELLLALASLSFATEVVVDDPQQSKGDNPDVMFRHGDTRWALACKVPNGESTISAFENIKAAVEQIERSDCDRGLIVFNARNWIDHDQLWRKPGGAAIGMPDKQDIHWAWPSKEIPFSMLTAEGESRFRAIVQDKMEELLDVFGESRKAEPALLIFLETATLVASPLGPMMARIGTFVLGPLVPPDEATASMTHRLNEAVFKLPEISDLDEGETSVPN